MTDDAPLFAQPTKPAPKPGNPIPSRIALAIGAVIVAVTTVMAMSKGLAEFQAGATSDEHLANVSYAFGYVFGGVLINVLIVWAIIHFAFIRPSRRAVSGKYFAVLLGVAAATFAGVWFLLAKATAPSAASNAASASTASSVAPADTDGFRQATDGQLAAYEQALGELQLGEALDVAAARAAVDDYRQKVGRSQVLVGLHRNKVVANVRNARLNANRRAGGGPEGQRAMADFDAAHAAALGRLNTRWALEAKVAEQRGLVLQTLAYDPDNSARLNTDLAGVRNAESALKTFKAANP